LLRTSSLLKANYCQTCSSLRADGRGRLVAGLVYSWCNGWCLGLFRFSCYSLTASAMFNQSRASWVPASQLESL
jgi:hypothetical protein